jgi:alanine-glyoxylate transaminase/(R)-3-amino-2-methylpropionate-pyruvate transaminase
VSTLYPTLPMVELAEKLVQLAPGKLDKRVLLRLRHRGRRDRGGLAQAATGRTELVALKLGYSGRSMLAQALTAHQPYRAVPTPDRGHQTRGRTRTATAAPSGRSPRAATSSVPRTSRTSSRPPPPGRSPASSPSPSRAWAASSRRTKDYFKVAYDIVKKYGGVFIADEVQTGFGRTGGKWWGIEHYGVEPDVMTMAKGIANGTRSRAPSPRPTSPRPSRSRRSRRLAATRCRVLRPSG